ncbi:MAG: tetratricopeptide repeat protein, partial [Planctomycetota bacterium JB042]
FRSGRFGETYVMDWGLARIVGRVDEHDLPPVESMRDDVDPASPLRTMAGEAVGTPFFMAPEQAQGRLEAIGPATDVYAMGCVLYRLLTGLHPYEEAGVSTSREVLDALLTGPPARPRRLDPDVPPELEAICERAMDRRVDRRYATMAEFADDLRAFQENRVVRAHATGPWAEFVKWVARNRAVARTAAFAVVALIGSTAFFVARIDRERRAAEESAEVAREVNAFLTDDLLAAVRPSPEEGRGRDVTMREVLDEASRRIEGRFEARPAVEAAIRRTLGSSYLELGEPAAAEPHFRRAAVVESARYGPGSAEALAVNNFLAMTLHDLGRYDEAERLLRSIAGAAAAALGEDHPEVLTYRSNLSVVLRKRGRLDEAAEIELDVLGRRSSRGELSSAVLTNLNGLALLHYRAGRYDEAEGLLARVVREAEASLGPYAPETLTYAQNLAGLYVEQGRGDEAEEIFVRALEGMSDVLGPDHGQTLNVSRNYAGLLRRRQRFEEAEARYREALERYRAAYGPGHVDTVGCLRDFAVLLLDRGRADEAMPLLEEALESQRRVFGPNHESTLSTLSSLAVVQYRRGRVEEAGARFEELLARRREVLGDDHPSTLTSMENLIAFHLERGASAAASALARELLERTPLDDARRAVREALLERARAGREDDD